MRFRPCIDLHQGVVKQIVGSTLREGEAGPNVNYTSPLPPAYFAELYYRDDLPGGHVIMLGPGNEAAAAEALAAFPGGLQLGGGMTPQNAGQWLSRGAAGIIVTSFVFCEGTLHRPNLEQMAEKVGCQHLILDLSCARQGDGYVVATDRWQRRTDLTIDAANLEFLAGYCSEFLIHATEVEGKQAGIDADLIRLLADTSPVPTTYAGGIRNLADVEAIDQLGQGRLDFTVGSALDLFGGSGVRYESLVALSRRGPKSD